MRADSLTILLVGPDFTPGSQFLKRLCRDGCSCVIAKNLEEARVALRTGEFDLVLSEIALPDGSAFPLLGLLEGAPASLFFSVRVHDGCWWLPALQRGRRTWGQAALHPAEFAHALASLLGAADLSPTAENSSPAETDVADVIPMPSVEIASPRPERVQTEKTKARRSSA